MWWNGNNKLEHPPAQKKVEERSCNISQSGTQHRGIYMQKRQGYPKLCGVYVWVFYTYFVLMSLKHIGKRSSWRECKEPKARSQSRDPPGNVTSLTTASKCEGYMLTFVFLPRPPLFFFCMSKTQENNFDISNVIKQTTKPTKQMNPKQFTTWLLSSSAFPALLKNMKNNASGPFSFCILKTFPFNFLDVIYLLQHRNLTLLKSTSSQFS